MLLVRLFLRPKSFVTSRMKYPQILLYMLVRLHISFILKCFMCTLLKYCNSELPFLSEFHKFGFERNKGLCLLSTWHILSSSPQLGDTPLTCRVAPAQEPCSSFRGACLCLDFVRSRFRLSWAHNLFFISSWHNSKQPFFCF